jgi:hypothetical protein
VHLAIAVLVWITGTLGALLWVRRRGFRIK